MLGGIVEDAGAQQGLRKEPSFLAVWMTTGGATKLNVDEVI
jgi:hypothetical protein